MRRQVRFIVVWSTCGLFHLAGWPGDFRQAYEAALVNDPGIRAARAELAAAQKSLPLAQAGLRPNITLALSDSKVDGTRSIDSPFGPAVNTPLDYRAPIQSLSLRMPLYNRELSSRVESARVQESQALTLFHVRQSDLVDRLATAWLQAGDAWLAIANTRSNLVAAQNQQEMVKTRLRLGEGTVTEVAEALAAVAFAQAQHLDAQNQFQLARLALRQIGGRDIDPAPVFSDGGKAQERLIGTLPIAQTLDILVTRAQLENPAIASRRYAADMAQLATAIRRAAHYPRLDLVASSTASRNESLSTLNQSATQQSIGLQFTVPIYSGGHTTAAVEQALADEDKAQAELLVEQQLVSFDVARHYFAVNTGVSKISAGQEGIKSASLAVQGSVKGLQAGFATRADIVADQRKLAQATFEQTKTISETLLSRIRLELKVGAGPEAVVELIESFLKASTDAN